MTPILEIHGISKDFPGVRALTDISLDLHRGELLAVVGENGAGKSTLMKILAGIHAPDRGSLRWNGQERQIRSPRDARALGIALVHQELNLAENLSIADNVFLGREFHRLGWLRTRFQTDTARRWLRDVGLTAEPGTLVRRLTLAQRQLVEIAKALALDARVLILDEPTASLSVRESERLFGTIRELLARGVSIIYISHRLEEIVKLASRVVVLRDGKCVAELTGAEIERGRLLQFMVGRDLGSAKTAPVAISDTQLPVLELIQFRTRAHSPARVSLRVRAGEIVGLAGLVGAGRTELLETMMGIRDAEAGDLRLAGASIAHASTPERIRAGMALVPEDRQQHGLVLQFSVRRNLTLSTLAKISRWNWILAHREVDQASHWVQNLGIRCRGILQLVRLLSGGNQQKVVLGRWLACQPRILLLDEPTRGVDVGTKFELYELLHRLAAGGMCILFASSDMEELLRLASRIYVMQNGHIQGELRGAEISEESIIRLATPSASQDDSRGDP